MATFNPNPNEKSEIWIERSVGDGLDFRTWHVIFFCIAGLISIVILACCCVKLRIPRTKQEIEADYQRKKIARKFREKLKLIENQEMDAMDLQKALEIIREDLNNENRNIELALLKSSPENADASGMLAEPQKPSNEGLPLRNKTT